MTGPVRDAVPVLHALAQALAVTNLYSPGHPATKLSGDNLWKSLETLFESDPHPIFLFLGSAPVYGGRALHEMREWQNGTRLAHCGIQRLEFDREAMTRAALDEALQRLAARLAAGAAPAESEPDLEGIAFGTVTVLEQQQAEAAETEETDATADAEGGEVRIDLADEFDALRYVMSEARQGRVARAEAEAVARILGTMVDEHPTMRAGYGDDADYQVVHATNTAVLAMVAAPLAGMDSAARHQLAVLALLHDIGMARLGVDLGNRARITDEERTVVEAHTRLGAELLLRSGGRGMELAAVVAFEHHLRPDGTGYPARRFPAAAHWASRMIGCCAAYAAIRAPRPYRTAWPEDRALRSIEDSAGTVFDAEAANLLVAALRAY
ncbi:MAG: HD-GYP domain-containing protein [Gemmatimonadales bacterium]